MLFLDGVRSRGAIYRAVAGRATVPNGGHGLLGGAVADGDVRNPAGRITVAAGHGPGCCLHHVMDARQARLGLTASMMASGWYKMPPIVTAMAGVSASATFASLRWGEVTALRRCDVDLEAGLCECARPSLTGARRVARSRLAR
jgi:hypothetical protein